jgi:MYXO-CTERM domain-containing protein
VTVKNSVISQNGAISTSYYGIRRTTTAGSVVNVTHNNVWDNGNTGTRNVLNVTLGNGCFAANPLYVNSASNLRITSNSPARFASDSGADIGALAYVSDPTPGLYGTLWQDTVLNAAGSPYTVAGDLTVPAGVTLTVQPGVTVTFTSGADIMEAGDDRSRGELTVRGGLNIAGQAGSPVRLTSSNSTSGSWVGVILLAGAADSALRHVNIERAVNGVRTDSLGGVTIQDASITQSSSNGVLVNAGLPLIDAVTLLQNGVGVRVDVSAGATITNAVIASSGQYGVWLSVNASSTRATTLINDTIHANAYDGVYVDIAAGANGAALVVRNSSITRNGKISTSYYGVRKSSSTALNITLSHTNLWDNGNTGSRNSLNFPTGSSMFSENPQHQSEAGNDLRLLSSSRMIDAGASTNAPARDRAGAARPFNGDGLGGAEWDIGAYEFVPAQVCGNGLIEVGEACDDGANNGVHGFCLLNCSGPGPRCGDGAINGPEVCDDGMNNGQYGRCASNCLGQGPRCGDGTTNGPEVCDDGMNNGQYNACNAACTAQGPRCGDGMTNGPESCDDGMNNGQYGRCNATCAGPGQRCGDGAINGPESCDDGASNGQYNQCNAACTGPGPRCGDGMINGNESCDDGAQNGQYNKCNATCSGAGQRCGDGMVNGGEQCDDGNAANDDACLNTCQSARCGDGFTRVGVEQCDDANMANTDACLNSCQDARCGDMIVQAGVEACDDGNMNEADGCTSSCRTASCGNGITDAGEDCDDGNMSNTDACLNTCLSASCGDGFLRIGQEVCDDGNDSDEDECLTTCRRASCGDGFVHMGVEPCDDGDDSFTDACLPTCEIAACGDGYVFEGEEACDDDNLDDGDGCSAMCEEEVVDPDMGADMGADMGVDMSDADMGGADMSDEQDMLVTAPDMAVTGDMDAGDMDIAGDMSNPPRPSKPAEDDGCGCVTVAQPRRTPAAWLLLGALGVIGALRRRRRA